MSSSSWCFMGRKFCALCGDPAQLYCQSDRVYLCSNCDARVHQANIIAARHLRCSIVCSSCTDSSNTSNSIPISSPECVADDDDDLTTCSTSESSSTTSPSAAVIPERSRDRLRQDIADHSESAANMDLEAIVVNWCERLCFTDAGMREMVVQEALRLRWNELKTDIPMHVLAAATIWRGIRLLRSWSGSPCSKKMMLMEKLQEISGFPAKVILTAESELEVAAISPNHDDAVGQEEDGMNAN